MSNQHRFRLTMAVYLIGLASILTSGPIALTCLVVGCALLWAGLGAFVIKPDEGDES